jgi:hypothetical protein
MYADWEIQSQPKFVLKFVVHSYVYVHYFCLLFGQESLKETYLHKLYLHLPGQKKPFIIPHCLDQFRIINFRDVSCEFDESRFRLVREITTSLSSSTSDFFIELVTQNIEKRPQMEKKELIRYGTLMSK